MNRPITMDELKEHARELPLASRAQGKEHRMLRRPHYSPSYYASHMPCDDIHFDKLAFRAERGSLDGTVVWYWTHQGVIVRVDV
jgi:hypothetical protein